MNLQILTGFLVCKITGNLLYFSAFTYFLNEYVLFSKSGKKIFFFSNKVFLHCLFQEGDKAEWSGPVPVPSLHLSTPHVPKYGPLDEEKYRFLVK